MKFLKLALAAAVAALCIGTASAQYQNTPPNAVGPLNAYGYVCNPTASVGYPAVGAGGCTLGQSFGPASTTASATLKFTSTTNTDVIQYSCVGF